MIQLVVKRKRARAGLWQAIRSILGGPRHCVPCMRTQCLSSWAILRQLLDTPILTYFVTECLPSKLTEHTVNSSAAGFVASVLFHSDPRAEERQVLSESAGSLPSTVTGHPFRP